MYLHAHKWSRLVFIEIAMATAARREMAAHRKSHAVSASGLKRRRVIFFFFNFTCTRRPCDIYQLD